jgi:hypothetical protein
MEKGKKLGHGYGSRLFLFSPPPKISVPLSFVSSFWSICFVSVKSS